ncbi:protein TAB2 homolog, chloroplastic-like [Actinidia eriantha]|uniref:protein TAB2 homolog, chloroplastic-like n=1 Tax=Actinidia eriantha TaxID=165200 RepID=UPI00258B56DE|nr:protein TAB2 homolog, chloroplastic-like [Actinidia eriantha]
MWLILLITVIPPKSKVSRVCFNGYSGIQSRQNPNQSVQQTHIQLHFPIKNLTQLPPKSRPFRYNSASEISVSAPIEAEAVDDEDDPIANLSFLDPETDPESISEWELDFCSRPNLNVRGKKVWELLVCDRTLSLQFTKYFPNNGINSITLKEAIVSISDELGVPLPDKCLSLHLWLEERYETVYTRHPGFQKGSKRLLALDNPFPMELPVNLFGDKWAFVQLPFSVIQQEVSSLETKYVFGASIDLDLLGIEIDEKTLIPGLAVASLRAKPLAAWMNGLELCSVEADVARACLILSIGSST